MSELTHQTDVAIPADVVAAQALVGLIAHLHTDPLARVLLDGSRAYSTPSYYVSDGELRLSLYDADRGSEQLSAALAVLGGTSAPDSSGGTSSTEVHEVTTRWQGVPLTVRIRLRREDVVAVLRKQLAEARADVGRLIEQRHQLDDPAVPPLAVAAAGAGQAAAGQVVTG